MPLAKLHNNDGLCESERSAESVQNDANDNQGQFVVNEFLKQLLERYFACAHLVIDLPLDVE